MHLPLQALCTYAGPAEPEADMLPSESARRAGISILIARIL